MIKKISLVLSLLGVGFYFILNIEMLVLTDSAHQPLINQGIAPDFMVTSEGMVHLNAVTAPGMIKIYSLNGNLLFQKYLNAHTRSISLPSRVIASGKAIVVCVSQGKTVYRKQIMML